MSSRSSSDGQDSIDDLYTESDPRRSSESLPALQERSSDEFEKGSVEEEEKKGVFDDLTDAQVLELVAVAEDEARHLNLENDVFWWYLEDNDPNLLMDLPDLLETAMILKFGDREEVRSKTRSRASKVSFGSVASLLQGRGTCVNLVQKSDMVHKAIEVKHAALQKFLKQSHVAKRKLLSELEEFRFRHIDITGALNIFESHIVIAGVDSLTQRIPAEKFLKYMHDWFWSAGSEIEKLRLRTSHMRLLYRKACALLESRQELRGSLHAVDFDKLLIENRRLSQDFDTKMVKQIAAAYNRELNEENKELADLQVEQVELRKRLEKIKESIECIERDCIKIQGEVLHAEKAYSEFMYIKDHYRVPDVMVYVNIKKEHAEILRQTKIWRRKKKVLDISLRASIKEMMNLTGAKGVNYDWFKEPKEPDLFDEATFNKLIDPHKFSMTHSHHGPHNAQSVHCKNARTISSFPSKGRFSQSSRDVSKSVGSGLKVDTMSEDLMNVVDIISI